MIKYRSILAFVALFFSQELLAMESDTSRIAQNFKLPVVEMTYSTLGGLQYSIEGTPLTSYKEIEELLKPLGDYETMRLIKRSESSDLLAKILGLIGFSALATGITGVLTASSEEQRGFWVTAAGGGLLYNISGLFRAEAQTAKFTSLQRYNRFARGEEQILPKDTGDEKALMNFEAAPQARDPEVKPPKK